MLNTTSSRLFNIGKALVKVYAENEEVACISSTVQFKQICCVRPRYDLTFLRFLIQQTREARKLSLEK